MAIRLPTPAPRAPTVRAPQVTVPGGNLVGGFMNQKPAAQMPTMQNLRPMPDYVKNNINLGWNYATGQVIPPLSAAQKAAVYIPPIGNLGIKTPTQPVIPPGGPALNTIKPGQPALPQQQYNWSVQTPVKPAVAFPGMQNMLISQFLPKAATPVAPVKPRIR
jgi:hypothetical protein